MQRASAVLISIPRRIGNDHVAICKNNRIEHENIATYDIVTHRLYIEGPNTFKGISGQVIYKATITGAGLYKRTVRTQEWQKWHDGRIGSGVEVTLYTFVITAFTHL